MAGQAGYYMVALNDGSAGIVKVSANTHPVSVGKQSVVNSAYLGTTQADILKNYDHAANLVAVGLNELGPPGSQQSTFGDGVDRGTLIQMAREHGSGILSSSPSSAEWDPTFTILAGGLGGIVSGAVRAAGAAAGAAGAADVNAATGATAGAATTGAASKVAGALKAAGGAVKTATAVAGTVGIASLFGNVELWKGIGLVIAGVLILLIAGRELAKL